MWDIRYMLPAMHSLKKLSLAAAATIVAALAFVPAAAQADNYIYGTCSNGVHWVYQEGPNGITPMWYDNEGNWGYGNSTPFCQW